MSKKYGANICEKLVLLFESDTESNDFSSSEEEEDSCPNNTILNTNPLPPFWEKNDFLENDIDFEGEEPQFESIEDARKYYSEKLTYNWQW